MIGACKAPCEQIKVQASALLQYSEWLLSANFRRSDFQLTPCSAAIQSGAFLRKQNK